MLDAVAMETHTDAMLREHTADLDKLSDGLKAETFDFGRDSTEDVAQLGQCRAVARVLRADAKRLLAEGDKDGAARRVAAIVRLGTGVAGPGRNLLDVMTGMALVSMAADFVKSNPALAEAAWKTDLQQALQAVGRGGTLNSIAALRSEIDGAVSSLRKGEPLDMRGTGGREWSSASAAEREDAAAKLAGLRDDLLRAWEAPDAVFQVKAVVARAKEQGIEEFVGILGQLRESIEKLRVDVGAANSVLRKK
jgi:hypothetical protein